MRGQGFTSFVVGVKDTSNQGSGHPAYLTLTKASAFHLCLNAANFYTSNSCEQVGSGYSFRELSVQSIGFRLCPRYYRFL